MKLFEMKQPSVIIVCLLIYATRGSLAEVYSSASDMKNVFQVRGPFLTSPLGAKFDPGGAIVP
jgi:hypothetical protein